MSEKSQERIDRFLSGEMSSDELLKFESDIKLDDNLNKQLIETKIIIESIKRKDLNAKLAFIKDLESDKADEKAANNKNLIYIVITALAAISVGTLFYFNTFTRTTINDSPYFIKYPDVLTERTDNLSDMSKAMQYYNLGNFESARREFEKVLSVGENKEARFYLGICLIAQEKYKEAISQLETLEHNLFPIDYYIGLAYWFIGDDDKSSVYFTRCTFCTDQMKEIVNVIMK